MQLRKIFQSASYAVTSAPAMGVGAAGTVQFPASVTNGGVLVRNQGSVPLVLFYSDAEPSGDVSWAALARQASLRGTGGGTHTIQPGGVQFLTDTIAGPVVTYSGGPFTAIAGTVFYTAELPTDGVTA